MELSGSEFLHKKYPDLHKSDQVQRSVDKDKRIEKIPVPNASINKINVYLDKLKNIFHNSSHKSEEKKSAPNSPGNKIDIYLNRLQNIFDNSNSKTKERNIKLFTEKFLYPSVLIDKNNVPDSYFELQLRMARERGQSGDLGNIKEVKDISREIRRNAGEIIFNDQKKSLDVWINYLTSSDSSYPSWFEYYTVKNVVKMGAYDKEKKEFSKRSKTTTGIFPDLNREALSFTYDVLQKYYLKHEKHNNEELNKILDSANFSKIYAYAIDKVTPASKENKEKTEGEWVKYQQGSDATPLYESLQGHGTGWCTTGEGIAKIQLENGDFYVYYSKDKTNKNTIPRIAIRMEGNKVKEVRGINADQNLEDNMIDIAKEKYHQLPGGEEFDKKDHDMRMLTQIDSKIKSNQSLTRDELRFLYEIDSKIEGFGFQEDPRIAEIRKQRNSIEDMPVIFGCDKKQIAHNIDEINQETKVYLGKIEPKIFDKLPATVEHIYTSFPDREIFKNKLLISGKSGEEWDLMLFKTHRFNIDDYARSMMLSEDFQPLKYPEEITTVRLKVQDLGFSDWTTTKELYKQAEALGLKFCPAETGPYMRMTNTTQPRGELLNIYMKPIAIKSYPFIFEVRRNDNSDGLFCLDVRRASSEENWHPNAEFVFCIPK